MSPPAPVHTPVFLVLAGPAGSGKTTLCERMVAEVPGFERVVTTTTRPARPGEVDGVHYHFLTPEEFDARVAAGAFLEWAWVHKRGHRYGTLASSVLGPLAEGRSLIINVDVQGVASIRAAAAHAPHLARRMATVFIDVPVPELRVRLQGRGETEAEIAHRMETAERELLEIGKFDFVIRSRDRVRDFQELLTIWREVLTRLGAG